MTPIDPTLDNSSSARKRMVLPFIDTGPLFDLQWLVLLLPLWWALGVEQFIWSIGMTLILLKVVALQRGKVVVSAPVKWFALFLIAIFVSSLFIVETERWLTYLRNLGAYVAGFLALFIVTNRVRTWASASRLLDAALLTITISSLFGLLAIADVWRPSFQSLFGSLLPAWIVATSYGHEIAVRVLGQPGWFAGLGSYYRINSLFLYGTHYASVLVFSLPFLLFRFAFQRGLRRILIGAAIMLVMINLVFTTGRVAMIALLGGGIYFMLFHSLKRKSIRALSIVLMAILVLGLLITSFLDLTSSTGESLLGNTGEAFQSLILARGSGSFTNRFAVYEASLRVLEQRPLFGWGTERDIPGLDLPAGSHSEYIAVLYRQGLFGIIAFAGLLWSTWRYSRPVSDSRKSSEAEELSSLRPLVFHDCPDQLHCCRSGHRYHCLFVPLAVPCLAGRNSPDFA